jgi:hypothetical protein
MPADEQYVRELISLCNPNGSYSEATRERVRQIGNRLNDQGGFSLMQQVHSLVAESGSRMHARILEGYWGGVGDWLA